MHRDFENHMPSEKIAPRAVVREALQRLIGEILEQPLPAWGELAPTVRLRDLGVSSLRMVNLVLAIEAQFAISIPPSEITPDNFRSLADLEALIVRLLAADG